MLLLKFNDMNRHSYESEILSSRIELDYNFIIYTIFGFCGLLFLWRFTVFLFLIVMEFDIGYYAYMRILLLLSPTICVLLEFGINKFCWLKKNLYMWIKDWGIIQECVEIHYDSKNLIHLESRKVYRKRIKHIDIRLYIIIDMIESNEIMVEKVDSDDNLVDVFVKSLIRPRFKHHLNLINFVEQ